MKITVPAKEHPFDKRTVSQVTVMCHKNRHDGDIEIQAGNTCIVLDPKQATMLTYAIQAVRSTNRANAKEAKAMLEAML